MKIFQRGFTLVTAIVILVVFAGLGAAIVAVSTTQQMGSALDIQSARAYRAARAGIEWGLFQVTPKAPGGTLGACFAATTFAFPAAADTLAGFSVTVTCTATANSHSGPAVLEIDALACNRAVCPGTPSMTYVERRMRVTI